MVKKTLLIILLFIVILTTLLLYNLELVVKEGLAYAGVQVDHVERMTIGKWRLEGVSYQMEKKKLTIESVELDFLDINVEALKIIRSIQAFSSRMKVRVTNVELSNYKIDEAKFDLHKKPGSLLEITNFYISDFGKKNLGTIKLDLNNLESASIDYKDISINHLVNYFDSKLNVSGFINVSATLDDDIINAKIVSNNLVLKGFKVDDVINNFLDSRSFGVMDVAGFMVLGPIGLLYTSAGSYGQTLNGFRGGETKFSQINIRVSIKKDILTLEDVAFSTAENMVSIAGKANIKSQTFENIIISILDDDYCPKLQQSLGGTFKKPDYSKTKAFLDTASAPITNLTNSTLNLIGINSCKPVYKGVVKFPRPK